MSGWPSCCAAISSDAAEVSPIDGVHLTRNGHLRLGEAMAEKIRSIFE